METSVDAWFLPVSALHLFSLHKAIREVALKLVRTDQWFGVEDTRSSVILARFREETRFAAQLEHPNIVRVYDVGQIDGLDYFSMQLIDGTDLSSGMKVQPLSFIKIADLRQFYNLNRSRQHID